MCFEASVTALLFRSNALGNTRQVFVRAGELRDNWASEQGASFTDRDANAEEGVGRNALPSLATGTSTAAEYDEDTATLSLVSDSSVALVRAFTACMICVLFAIYVEWGRRTVSTWCSLTHHSCPHLRKGLVLDE